MRVAQADSSSIAIRVLMDPGPFAALSARNSIMHCWIRSAASDSITRIVASRRETMAKGQTAGEDSWINQECATEVRNRAATTPCENETGISAAHTRKSVCDDTFSNERGLL